MCDRRPLAPGILALAFTTLMAGGAAAQVAGAAAVCGQSLSAPVQAKWTMLGGPDGLGCPTAVEMATAASPQGSAAREATFPTAAILWHASGAHAGQTFAVSGCAYRLYFQYGGPGGWLGLPTSDAVNTPDGQRQTFEGGVITYRRAYQECEAEHTAATQAQATSAKAPLDQFHDPARGDDVAAASVGGIERILAAHYQRVRTEGYVFTEPGPGLIPLKAYWNEAVGAHIDVASPETEREAQSAGYVFDGAQGYVYADPHPGARPLKLFHDAGGGHDLLTATDEGQADALARGYLFVRIEGYLPTLP
jgi:hypothetical protein